MASSPEARELLARAEGFASLDEASLDLLAQRMHKAVYAPGELICREGETGDWMFVVASGDVAVIKQVDDGTPVCVAHLGPGDFGGMMSLFEAEPRSATLEARGTVELWILSHETFMQFLEAARGAAAAMLGFMSRRMRSDSENLASTLRYVSAGGLQRLYETCSPQERLLLDTVNGKVAAQESLDALMEFLFDAFRQLGPNDRMCLAFVEEDGKRVTARWVKADYEPLHLTQDYAEDLQGSSLAAVLRSGVPRVIGDLEQYLRDHPTSRATRLMLQEGLRSSMACPLLLDGRCVGLLFRSSREPYAYDDHQVRMQQAVAEHLTQGVEKAYRIEQLQAANHSYLGMLAFVSHELKGPLASLVMNGKLLTQGFVGEITEAQRQRVDKFSRLRSPELLKRPGTGVGLYTSWQIAQLHGGRIDAESDPGHWAQFTPTLPRRPKAASQPAATLT